MLTSKTYLESENSIKLEGGAHEVPAPCLMVAVQRCTVRLLEITRRLDSRLVLQR